MSSQEAINTERVDEKASLLSNENAIVDIKGEDPPVEFVDEPANASVASATFNLSNTIIGAGILTLPFALKCSGLSVGLGLLFFVCTVSNLSMQAIIKLCERTGTFSYLGLARAAWGNKVAVLIQFLIMIYTSGICIAFSVLLGDFFPMIFDHFAPGTVLANRGFMMYASALVILMPLCIMRDMNRLRFTSFLSLIFVLFAVFVVCFRFNENGIGKDVNYVFSGSWNVFIAIPLMSVSFTCHYNAPVLYKTLKTRTTSQMAKVINFSSLICISLYVVMATTGYLMFGTETEGDILHAFSSDDHLALFSRLGLTATILFSFPLIFHASRSTFESLFFGETACSNTRNFFETFIGIFSCVSIAFANKKIENVMAYNGSLFGTFIVYILPGLMYYIITKKETGKKPFFSPLLVLIGVVFCVSGFIVTTLKLLGKISEN